MRSSSIFLVLILLVSTSSTMSQIPHEISFQGILDDVGAPPLNGDFEFHFRLYDAESGGTMIWEEIQDPVTVTDGVFSVYLGRTNPITNLPWFNGTWLSVEVDQGAEFPTRVQFAYSPYSFVAETVPNGAITGPKIAGNTVVRRLNGLSDAVNLVGGDNITIVESPPDLIIGATGGGGPDNDWIVVEEDMYSAVAGRVEVTGGPFWIQDVVELQKDFNGNGYLTLFTHEGVPAVQIAAQYPERQGVTELVLNHDSGIIGARLLAGTAESALELYRLGPPSHKTVDLRADGGDGYFDGASASLMNHNGQTTIELDADVDDGAELSMRSAAGDTTVLVESDASGAGRMTLSLGSQPTVVIGARQHNDTDGAYIDLRNHTGDSTLQLDGDSVDGAKILLRDGQGDERIQLAGDVTNGARIRLRNGTQETVNINSTDNNAGRITLAMADGTETIDIMAQEHTNPMQGAAIYLKNAAADTTIELDGDMNGTGRIITDELEITGADLAEPFAITDGQDLPAGALVVIDEDNSGCLTVSRRAYDRRVAGVISGAGGIHTGIMMNRKENTEGRQSVALSGRVYAMADASGGAIRPGDLLTTSNVTGRAMKATDPDRSQGAIIGKAMTSLAEGQGLVLVLVSLQ